MTRLGYVIAAVKAWARSYEHKVADRRRIRQDIIDAYFAAGD